MSFARSLSSFVRNISASTVKNHRLVSTLGPTTAPMSCMYSRKQPSENRNLLQVATQFTAHKSSATLHTEGDRRFVELLDDEIKQEKERSMALTKMSDGWKASFDGASGKLTKTHDGDKIEVTFSLNGSIPPLQEEEMDQVGDDEDQMVASYPEFSVKVSKPGSRQVMELECFFPEDVQDGVTDDEDPANLFSIRSVIIYEGEVTDGTFIIDTDNLEPQFYSYLLSYLADRGVDNQFADEFVDFTTAAEQKEYIHSLQKLKDFIGSK